jgi:hypothetical protein
LHPPLLQRSYAILARVVNRVLASSTSGGGDGRRRPRRRLLRRARSAAGGGWLGEGEAGQRCRVTQRLAQCLLTVGWDPGGGVELAPECLDRVVGGRGLPPAGLGLEGSMSGCGHVQFGLGHAQLPLGGCGGDHAVDLSGERG